MTERPPIPAPIRDGRLIVVGRRVDVAVVPRFVESVVAGGVHVIELTMDDPENVAVASVEALARIASEHDVLPGAGTIRSVAAARLAVEAGARFLVSPHTDTDVAAWCAERGVPCVMGAFTPSEMQAAWMAGASAVKLFPSVTVGPGYLAQISGPFPDISVIPTGVDDPDTVGDWLAVGATAIGIRSGWLAGDGEPSGITTRVRRMVDAVSSQE